MRGIQELDGLLGLAMAALEEIRTEIKLMHTTQESKKATKLLMEDNLAKGKRVLMVPKIPCPTTHQ